MFEKNRKLTLAQFVTLNIVLISVIFISVFYFLWIKHENERFKNAINEAKTIYLESKKQALKTVVQQFYFHLKIQLLYEKKAIEEKLNVLIDSTRFIKNVDELKRRCFSIKKKDNMINFVCLKRGKILFSSVHGFDLDFLKKNSDIYLFKKRTLENLNVDLYFVVFKKDFNGVLTKKLLTMFQGIAFNYSGYLFIVDSEGTILLSAHRLMNVKISDMSDTFGSEAQRIILNKALNEGEGFVKYTWFKPDLKTVSRKISYLKYDKNLKWIFGAGIYLDDIDKSFAPIYKNLRRHYSADIVQVSFLIAVIMLLDLGFLLMIFNVKFTSDFKKIEGLLDNFNDLSEEEIGDFTCENLSFRETCRFASTIKNNLIEIKKVHKELLNLNMEFKETSTKFKTLAEHINNGVAIIDKDLNIEFVNLEFGKIFNKSEENLVGHNLLEFFPIKNRRKILLITEKVLNGENDNNPLQLSFNIDGDKKFLNIHFSQLELEKVQKLICTIMDTTEREKLLEKLRFLTHQYEKAEKMAKVGNWIYYPDTRCFWATKECFEIYEIKLTSDHVIPSKLLNSKIYKEDLPLAIKTTFFPLENKKPFEVIFRIVPGVGRIKFLVSKSEPVFNEKGEVVRVEGVLQDVTDLKNIENELQKHIRMLEKTQKLSKLGYWEYDLQKEEFEIFSPFFKNVLKTDRISLKDLISFVVPEDKHTVFKTVSEKFKSADSLNGSFRVILPYYNVLAYVYFESDEIISAPEGKKRIGWIQDITGIKELEQRIEEERERLIKIINSLNEGVVLLDKDLNFLFVNESFKGIFRQSKIKGNLVDFLNRMNLKGISNDISLNNFEEIFSDAKKGVLNLDDVEIVLSIVATRLKKTRDFKGYVFVVEDITSKEKYTEEVIKTQNIKLLNKIAASLAHDLNNLLGSILGKISILEKQVTDLKTGKELHKVIRNIDIAKTLATQFLAFSKSGKPLFVHIEKATISQIIGDLSEFIFSGSSIQVETNISDELWPLKGDKTQIAQIVLNLLNNAREVLGEKGKVKISVENFSKLTNSKKCRKGDYVLMKISDNGPGISKEKLKSIFEFFVGYKKEGFGLGLAIVKNIVDSHGGCLDVDSKEGKGTTFFIYLPAVKTGKIEITTSSPDEKQNFNIEDDVDIHMLRVAVLEDEPPMQETIYDLLDYVGVQGDIFAKGEELIDAVKQGVETGERYDIALLDLTIKGGLGGKDVVNIIKKIDSNIFAVVSSGYSKDPIMANFSEYGFDGALPKPYSLEEFENALKFAAKKIKGT